MPLVTWEEVTKAYGEKLALDRVTLSVDEGEILCVLGPSGSGKSTLLRITAGLESLTSGRVASEGRDMSHVPPHLRSFGLMFQDYCLFPHMSVAQNVAFGLRMKRWDRRKREERTREMLRLVRMEEMAPRSVLSLSGGEQQRVALARSLAPSPRLLMLDEPLGALDAALRSELIVELGRILRAVGATAVYVTHDQGEAMTIASRVAILNAGRVEQAGEPDALIQRPVNGFVAAFLGLGAMVPGVPIHRGGAWVLRTELGDFPSRSHELRQPAARPAARWSLLLRPSAIRFAAGPGLHRAPARIIGRSVKPAGVTLRILLRSRKGVEYPLECFLPGEGDSVGPMRQRGGIGAVWIDPRNCVAVRL